MYIFFAIAIIIGAFIGVCIGAMFLSWAAAIVGIEDRTFGKAVTVIVLNFAATAALAYLLGTAVEIPYALSVLSGFIIEALIIMPVYDTKFPKALGASLISFLLVLMVFGVLYFVFGG